MRQMLQKQDLNVTVSAKICTILQMENLYHKVKATQLKEIGYLAMSVISFQHNRACFSLFVLMTN